MQGHAGPTAGKVACWANPGKATQPTRGSRPPGCARKAGSPSAPSRRTGTASTGRRLVLPGVHVAAEDHREVVAVRRRRGPAAALLIPHLVYIILAYLHKHSCLWRIGRSSAITVRCPWAIGTHPPPTCRVSTGESPSSAAVSSGPSSPASSPPPSGSSSASASSTPSTRTRPAAPVSATTPTSCRSSTTVGVAARNACVVVDDEHPVMSYLCSTCYAVNKKARNILDVPDYRAETNEVLAQIGREYDDRVASHRAAQAHPGHPVGRPRQHPRARSAGVSTASRSPRTPPATTARSSRTRRSATTRTSWCRRSCSRRPESITTGAYNEKQTHCGAGFRNVSSTRRSRSR